MLTCKDFLNELSSYLDDSLDPEIRARLHQHVSECPNCWVVLDTTQKTIRVFKGMEPQNIPADIHSRLVSALQKRIASRGSSAAGKSGN
ncbi:MAG: zf-HC2 domain-containing protein [Bryobacteraceae bacterium]|nr:zf-HC2 domain-containing protein [Bryobacteraceae bacterium]